MCCPCWEKGHSGYWELKNNKIIIRKVKVDTLVGGKVSGEGTDLCEIVGAKVKTETFNPPKVEEMTIKSCQKPSDIYPCINIGGQDYYKFNDDPSSYGEFEKFSEPNF